MVVKLASIPHCQTWNLQVDNYWMESLDYRYHRISINKETATVSEDESVIILISPSPLNAANVLTTAGHSEGTLCFRWVGTNDPIHPMVKVVEQSEVA